jgi:hypothetical protein
MHGYKRCCRWDLNHQPFCSLFLQRSVFSYLWKEIFHEGKAVYGKHVGIFPCLLLCSIQVNIPMHAGEIFYVIFLFHTKLIFPCMQGDLNKSYISNIFVGSKWKFTFQTKPLWGFATVYLFPTTSPLPYIYLLTLTNYSRFVPYSYYPTLATSALIGLHVPSLVWSTGRL